MPERIVRRAALALLLALAVPAVAAAQRVNADRRQLAVKGYDVVAYFTEGRPVPGVAAFEHAVGGVTYRFASAANRDRFAREPQRYLPQYGGYCAWAVAHDYTYAADPETWRIVDGRLFLNYDRGVQRLWEQDIPGRIAKADENWKGLSAR